MSINIRKKIIINTIVISWISIAIATGLIIWQASSIGEQSLAAEAKSRLTSIRYFKSQQVVAYFEDLVNDLFTVANSPVVVSALQDFAKTFPTYLAEAKPALTEGYKSQLINNYLNDFSEKYKRYNIGKTVDAKIILNLASENGFALQYKYIFENQYPISNKDKLESVKDGTKYSLMHAQYHQSLRMFKQNFGFYDILLVDANTGDVVYTVNKETEFTTSLINGPYAKSGLGEVFRKTMAATKINSIAMADFAPHLAFYDNQSAFLGAAIFDNAGNKIGVIIIQLSVDALNNIMTNHAQWEKIGLGKSLNAVIVGPDFILRTSNRFFVENANEFLDTLKTSGTDQHIIDLIKAKNSIIGVLKTDTLAVREAFAGKEGFIDYVDYRKVPVLGSFAPLNIPGLNWVMVVKINQSEAFDEIAVLKEHILSSGLKIAILIALLAVFVGSSTANAIVKSIYKITDGINDIAQSKDLTRRLPVPQNSEFTVMVNAFNNFVANVQLTLKSIIDYSSKTQTRVSNKLQDEDQVQREVKQDIFNLTDQINDLSHEFKLLDEENERTKYW